MIFAKTTQKFGLPNCYKPIVLVGIWQISTIYILYKLFFFIMPEFDKSKFWFHEIPNLEKIPRCSQEEYFKTLLSGKRAHNNALVWASSLSATATQECYKAVPFK